MRPQRRNPAKKETPPPFAQKGSPGIIIASGMRRSGSTWMFNALRFILEEHGYNPYFRFRAIFDPADLKQGVAIIKTHKMVKELAKHADVIITSHRDLRDVAASSVRFVRMNAPKIQGTFKKLQDDVLKQKEKADLEEANAGGKGVSGRAFPNEAATPLAIMRALRLNFRDYKHWAAIADYDMRYEDMVRDPVAEVERLSRLLKMPVDAQEIVRKVNAISEEAHKSEDKRHQEAKPVGYFRKYHVTDGGFGTYLKTISENVATRIERVFGRWQMRQGYGLNHIKPSEVRKPKQPQRPRRKQDD